MKQHYDLVWNKNTFEVYELAPYQGESLATVWNVAPVESCGDRWAYCVRKDVSGFRLTLVAAKRAAITRLMASTEEL